jgi:hypothetical protein
MGAEALPHLWEPEHDYYGPEGCHYADGYRNRDNTGHYASWAEFVANGDLLYDSGDPGGLNFLYRWDWHAWHLTEYEPDEPERWQLELFWMLPRKGIMLRTEIAVTPEDEPAVRAWLEPRWRYMQELWAPVSAVAP